MRPQKAVEEYVEKKKRNHRSTEPMVNFTHRLQPFLDFCETVELRDMSQMTRRTAGLYKRDRVEHADLTPSTLQQQLRTFRDFLEYCGKEEAVEGARISLAF